MTRPPARPGAPEGGLVVDKPAGPTSHDVVALARRSLGQPRVGHTGTLDPMATGVLPLLLGRATRLARFLAADRKSYEAAVRFGQATSTYDAEGTPVGPATRTVPDRAAIEEMLERFRGRFDQVPPIVSAKKVGGHRAYTLARAAAPVTLAPVAVEVSRLEMVRLEGAVATLHIDCSAGFYVRSLAHDLGVALGVGAHLAALRRTRSGPFVLDDCVSIEQLADASGDTEVRLIGMVDLLPDLLARSLSPSEAEGVTRGRDVSNPCEPTNDCPSARFVRLLAPDGRLAAVAEARRDALHPLVVLL
jgi:tRNA pseudouridine55 synthase